MENTAAPVTNNTPATTAAPVPAPTPNTLTAGLSAVAPKLGEALTTPATTQSPAATLAPGTTTTPPPTETPAPGTTTETPVTTTEAAGGEGDWDSFVFPDEVPTTTVVDDTAFPSELKADPNVQKYLSTQFAQDMYANHKTYAEIAKQLSLPEDQGGMGGIPAPDEIVNGVKMARDHTLMHQDFLSGDPNRIQNFVQYWFSERFPKDVLATNAQQLYTAARNHLPQTTVLQEINAIGQGFLQDIITQIDNTKDDNARLQLRAGRKVLEDVLKLYETGEVANPASATPKQPQSDPERERLARENEELRKWQQSQLMSVSRQEVIGPVRQAISSSVDAILTSTGTPRGNPEGSPQEREQASTYAYRRDLLTKQAEADIKANSQLNRDLANAVQMRARTGKLDPVLSANLLNRCRQAFQPGLRVGVKNLGWTGPRSAVTQTVAQTQTAPVATPQVANVSNGQQQPATTPVPGMPAAPPATGPYADPGFTQSIIDGYKNKLKTNWR